MPEEAKICSETGKPLVKISEEVTSKLAHKPGSYFIKQIVRPKYGLPDGEGVLTTYDAMLAEVLKSGNVFYDQTPVDMLDPDKGKTHQAYMWVLVGGKTSDPGYRIYDFRINRCHYNAEELLKGYREVLHSDKYGAYEALANKKQFTWCPCWSHIRRKFIEAESGDPPFRDWVLRKNLVMVF